MDASDICQYLIRQLFNLLKHVLHYFTEIISCQYFVLYGSKIFSINTEIIYVTFFGIKKSKIR